MSRSKIVMQECGFDGYSIHSLAVDNAADGTPNTYSMLAAQSGKSERTIIRICQNLERAGHIAIERHEGRGNKSVIVPLNTTNSVTVSPINPDRNPDINCDINPDKPLHTSPLSSLEKKQQTTTTPLTPQRRNGRDPNLTKVRPDDSVWLPLLGTKVDVLARNFGELSGEFTNGMVRGTLLDAEADVGPVSEEALLSGLKAAHAAIQRSLAAEKGGGKPIGNLRPYAAAVVAAKVREAVR